MEIYVDILKRYLLQLKNCEIDVESLISVASDINFENSGGHTEYSQVLKRKKEELLGEMKFEKKYLANLYDGLEQVLKIYSDTEETATLYGEWAFAEKPKFQDLDIEWIGSLINSM